MWLETETLCTGTQAALGREQRAGMGAASAAQSEDLSRPVVEAWLQLQTLQPLLTGMIVLFARCVFV